MSDIHSHAFCLVMRGVDHDALTVQRKYVSAMKGRKFIHDVRTVSLQRPTRPNGE